MDTNGARFVPIVDLTNSLADQHEVNLCLFQSPVTHPQNVFAFVRLQKVVHIFAQLAREVLCDCHFVLRIRSRQKFVNAKTGNIESHKLHAQFLRLFSLHDDVNDANRAGANRLQNKQQTHLHRACKFSNSDMKQTRDFPEDKGNCFPESPRKQIREFGDEVTSSSGETRRASVEFFTEQRLETLHSESLRQKNKSRIFLATSALDRVG